MDIFTYPFIRTDNGVSKYLERAKRMDERKEYHNKMSCWLDLREILADIYCDWENEDETIFDMVILYGDLLRRKHEVKYEAPVFIPQLIIAATAATLLLNDESGKGYAYTYVNDMLCGHVTCEAYEKDDLLHFLTPVITHAFHNENREYCLFLATPLHIIGRIIEQEDLKEREILSINEYVSDCFVRKLGRAELHVSRTIANRVKDALFIVLHED